jgi:hypothetical protein
VIERRNTSQAANASAAMAIRISIVMLTFKMLPVAHVPPSGVRQGSPDAQPSLLQILQFDADGR